MIGKLKGIVEDTTSDQIIINVNGVGYLVLASTKTIKSLPIDNKTNTSLLIHTQVKEDSITLYGFVEPEEKEWFLKLTSVKGVGPKLGLLILSYLTVEEIYTAILAKDYDRFNSISGIGKKTSERIITELKDNSVMMKLSSTKNTSIKNNIVDDAVSALENLGFSKSDSYSTCISIVNDNSNIMLSDLIRISLKVLSK